MFPGIPGMGKINPAQMQAMMKKLGIKSEQLPAKKVTIELEDKTLEIAEPSVTVIEMQGQKTFQVMGEVSEKETGVPQADVKMVSEQAGVSEEKAREELEKTKGDIAQAIANLKKE